MKRSTPSLTTARATALALIWSDFPGSALTTTGGAHHLRRRTNDPFTRRDQRPLKASGEPRPPRSGFPGAARGGDLWPALMHRYLLFSAVPGRPRTRVTSKGSGVDSPAR